MENKTFCQSCSMPLDTADAKGTEKDGSKSNDYCKYCYTNGAFINPGMTMDEMKVIVKTQLQKMNSPTTVINKAIAILPELKRWKTKAKGIAF